MELLLPRLLAKAPPNRLNPPSIPVKALPLPPPLQALKNEELGDYEFFYEGDTIYFHYFASQEDEAHKMVFDVISTFPSANGFHYANSRKSHFETLSIIMTTDEVFLWGFSQ